MDVFKATIAQKLSFILSNLNKYRRGNPLEVVVEFENKEDQLWLDFSCQSFKHSLLIPIPYRDGNCNYVLGRRVKRAVSTWVHQETEYDYWSLMSWLLTGRIETAFPSSGRKSQLEKLVISLENRTSGRAFRYAQELLCSIINKLPLTKTPMETWAMCNRVSFLDPTFKSLTPKESLEYQKELNKKFFPWSSIGLSDSGMINNDLLKVDLRPLTPFGLKHHNPKRNLYQTLGMKGDEYANVITESSSELRKQGISRKGWNLMTCFLDLPITFEDQLILDNRHLDKFTLEELRIICHNQPKVCAGDTLEEGSTISIEPDGAPLKFWVKCDNATVVDVKKEAIAFNGSKKPTYVVHLETKHVFKEGTKFNNRHGNKGVATFADCGTMFDKGRGRSVPIDIIVSAQTVGKRKNYGQIIEALLTLIRGEKEEILLPDNAGISLKSLQAALSNKGYSSDGTSPVNTQWFRGETICGWSFWGLIKNPENQLWTKADIKNTNGRDLRTSGLKISHIELKGLTTIFGPKNPVIEEILSHQQGVDDVCELVSVLEVLRGRSYTKPVLCWDTIKPLNQSIGYFHSREEIKGTIADEELCKDGFMLKLPVPYHVFIPDSGKTPLYMELVTDKGANLPDLAKPDGDNIFIDNIYVPTAALRASWPHPTGLLGLSDLSGLLNNVILACHNLNTGDEPLNRALTRYFSHISQRLSTKRGEIATYALSVRYPHSAKATATLSKIDLPENWLEIHEDMAEGLGVKTGDFVIAERFPCLGFKSLRIQRVAVTDDPQCKYVIRVSGNSLVSQNLDFDGDVLFLMSFKTKEARAALEREFVFPGDLRKRYILEANETKKPQTKPISLTELELETFDPLTKDVQAEIVGDLTGIKRGTGTAVALAYNLMRIIEGNVGYEDRDTNLAIEVILDKVANSVFSQKHFGESLEDKCRAAICQADVSAMLKMGFPETGSRRLCEVVRKEARALGIQDLSTHFHNHLTKGTSNIINLIVRKKHKVYFATRSNLDPVRLLQHLDAPATDLVSHLWQRSAQVIKGKINGLPTQENKGN
jgi:hypothetical protein